MGKPFASGKHAFGFCDICGFRYPLHELKTEVINLEQTDTRACPECWSPDNPQTQLGRYSFDDPQALRNPRPVGAISGRDLPAAIRWDFSTGTALTSPTRIDGWWSTGGIITWNSSSETLNLVSDGDAGSPGDPWLNQGYNGASVANTPLSIDSSVYKYVVSVFKVNRFSDIERDDRYEYDFQGDLFWSKDTTMIGRVAIEYIAIDRSGNGSFSVTAGTGPSVGDRVQLNGLSGSYPQFGGGAYDLSDLNGLPPTSADGSRENWTVTAASSTSFTISGLEISGVTLDGAGSSQLLSGSPTVGPSYPWTGGAREFHSADTSPYIPNYQASDGFQTVNRDMAGWFKVVWDMTDNPQWSGTITGLRLDYFDARNAADTGPDYDAGDIDIDYIEVVAFHNPDL
mgnify:CR=1 FL=1|tara:strand:+ start:92 stop:1288 length:1197 start_codon:yes stop_codon:yes gene_type:complete